MSIGYIPRIAINRFIVVAKAQGVEEGVGLHLERGCVGSRETILYCVDRPDRQLATFAWE